MNRTDFMNLSLHPDDEVLINACDLQNLLSEIETLTQKVQEQVYTIETQKQQIRILSGVMTHLPKTYAPIKVDIKV